MPLMEGGSVAVRYCSAASPPKLHAAACLPLSFCCLHPLLCASQDAMQLVYPGGIKDDALVATILHSVMEVGLPTSASRHSRPC